MSVLGNAAQILNCFGRDCTALTVTGVASRLGIPMANASRLMKAMREAGLLETIGDSKRHRPGRMLLHVEAAFRGSSDLIAMASAVVDRVSAACGHTGFVSVRHGNAVTAVQNFPGTNALRVVNTIGRPVPAHTSATGRSLLARMPDEDVSKLLDGVVPGTTPQSPGTVEAVLAVLQQVRARGFATSRQEAMPGVDAFGVAVGDPETGEAVSLCIVFPAVVVPVAEQRQILAGLLAGAADIARRTGDKAFTAPDDAPATIQEAV